MGKEVIKDEEKLPFCSPAILMNARYFYEEGIYENWKNINMELCYMDLQVTVSQ